MSAVSKPGTGESAAQASKPTAWVRLTPAHDWVILCVLKPSVAEGSEKLTSIVFLTLWSYIPYPGSKSWETYSLSFPSLNYPYLKVIQPFVDQYNTVQMLSVSVSDGACLKNTNFCFFFFTQENRQETGQLEEFEL